MYSAKEIEELNAKNIEYPDGSMHTLYEAEQQQRAFERKIRATKRTLAACDEALNNLSDEELLQKSEKNFSHYSSKLKRQESELNSFCKKQDYFLTVHARKFTNLIKVPLKNLPVLLKSITGLGAKNIISITLKHLQNITM